MSYQVVLGKEIDGLKSRIMKLQDKVSDLTHENSRLRDMLSIYEKSQDNLDKQNHDLLVKLTNELVRKWRIEDEMLI